MSLLFLLPLPFTFDGEWRKVVETIAMLPALAFVSSLIGSTASIPAMLFLGWPWLAYLRSTGILMGRYVIAGACVIGILSFSILLELTGSHLGPHTLRDLGFILLVGTCCGVAGGGIFCAIAGVPFRRRGS